MAGSVLLLLKDVSSEYSGAREYSEPDIRLFDLVNVFKQSHANTTLDPRHARNKRCPLITLSNPFIRHSLRTMDREIRFQ